MLYIHLEATIKSLDISCYDRCSKEGCFKKVLKETEEKYTCRSCGSFTKFIKQKIITVIFFINI